MKGSRTTCLLCRHIITTSGRSRASQWEAQAARLSSTSASPPQDTAAENPKHNSGDNPGSSRVRRVLPSQQKLNPTTPWSKIGRKKLPPRDSARTDAIFHQIVGEQTTRINTSPGEAQNGTNMDLALVQAIGKLGHMIDKGQSEAEAYAYLKTEIYPMLRKPDVTIPRVFSQVVLRLMDNIVAAKRESPRSPELPTVADIFRVYADIGEMKPQRWATLVGDLVQSIVNIDPSTEKQATTPVDEKLATRDAMLIDLVESWKVLSLPGVVPTTPDNDLTDGFWFPKLNKHVLVKSSGLGNFPAALGSLFSQYHANQLGAPVAVLAIATYTLLLDPQRSNMIAKQSAARFIFKVAYLITFVNYGEEALRTDVLNTFPGLENYIMGQWPIIKKKLKDTVDSMSSGTTFAPPSNHVSSTTPGTIIGPVVASRLNRAFVNKNPNEVSNCWQGFVGSGDDISPERVMELQKNADLFDLFINIWMGLNKPDRAIIALNTLRKVGLRPTVKTWNSMLDGCKKARNINGLKNVWAKIAASKIKLDMRIWTTRVSGLMEGGDFEGGIQALQEMAQLWKKSRVDENVSAVEPTIEPINAALVGLLRNDQVSTAESLLAWASRQGIEPDAFTFNTLLRRFVRDGRHEDGRRLFSIMKNAGIQANEATFTIILDSAFSKIAPNDVETQAQTVTDVLNEMEAAGLEANMQTYGKLVHTLLQAGGQAQKALKFVLAHLWGQGHEISPQIYTMLLENYFARSPPDLDAVEALLQRRRLLHHNDVDRILSDRVIRGYVMVGQTDKALDMYYQVSNTNTTISLSTSRDLLHALLNEGRIDEARGIVANTKKMYKATFEEATEASTFWRHPFWQLAVNAGIFDQEDPTTTTSVGNGTRT